MKLDVLNDNEPLSEEMQKLDYLRKEYFDRGFKEFDTWDKESDEQIIIYERCIKENKSYEEIFDDEEYDPKCDY